MRNSTKHPKVRTIKICGKDGNLLRSYILDDHGKLITPKKIDVEQTSFPNKFPVIREHKPKGAFPNQNKPCYHVNNKKEEPSSSPENASFLDGFDWKNLIFSDLELGFNNPDFDTFSF